MRIAVFGGSFNPVHEAHMTLARTVIERGLTDRVWMIPCRRNPLKEGNPLFSDEDRLAMLRLAIKDEEPHIAERMEVCDLEFHLPEPSYTWRTLQALTHTYPQHEFYLLIGGDSLETFNQWARPDEILRLARLIIYPRPGGKGVEETFQLPEGSVWISDVKLSDVSSTKIRNILLELPRKEIVSPELADEEMKLPLPDSVKHYIHSNYGINRTEK